MSSLSINSIFSHASRTAIPKGVSCPLLSDGTIHGVIQRMLSVGIQTQWGMKGDVKEGLELTPMGSFDVGQRGMSRKDWS